MKRRHFIFGSAATLTLASLPVFAAQTERQPRFVWIILRGAMDGLSALVPYADPGYSRLRKSTAIPVGGSDGAFKLDADFALHPALANLHRWYQQGQVKAWPAVATYYRERSHFDGQNVLESGGNAPYQLDDGWLNRALQVLRQRDLAVRGLAVGSSVPLTLTGSVEVESWSPSRLPAPADDLYSRLSRLYAEDEMLSTRLQSLQQTKSELDSMTMDATDGRNNTAFTQLVDAAAQLMSVDGGPQVATLELGGWDTHANQGSLSGRLANQLTMLDRGLASLAEGLGDVWNDTRVLVMTEFGRTAAENGTGGTDHGTASLAFALGGAIKDGGIRGDWPGLAASDLYQNRDLRPMTDARDVIADTIRQSWSLTEAEIAKIFPVS